ncbi:MAG: ATP synthase F0 subunit C [Chloroflexi bacterium]|jgi:F-type H+-transporting ATPase subunit c|nr:ATP synthase F0 subunit C [Chloroflexota bacterium]
MWQLDAPTLITVLTIVFSVGGIVLGSIIPGIVEGIATKTALEGIARQPDAAGDIRTTLLISMALLESGSIYVLLVVLILIFANPLLDRFFM